MIYDLFLFFVLVFQFLKIPFSKKKGPVIRKRWNFPKDLKKRGGPLYWFHAVSFGEMKAILPFIQKVQKELPEVQIWVSTITETGFSLAKELKNVTVFYLPFDFSYVMKKVKNFSPQKLFLSEGDYWPHFLQNAKKAGAHITVLSAKFSDRSFSRYKRVPFLGKSLFSLVDLFCTQNTLYQKRFLEMGVNLSKVQVTGNLKLHPQQGNLEDYTNRFSLEKEDFVLTIGSSHDPEESLILHEIKPLLEKNRLKVFLAPRHIERAASLSKLLEIEGVSYNMLSDKKASFAKVSVILVDQMGVLPSCYKASNLAIVAGSFHPSLEGHNVLEPVLLQVPVIFGPYTSSQIELKDLVLDYKAGKELPISELKDFLHSEKKDLASMKKQTSLLKSSLEKTLETTWKAVFEKSCHQFSKSDKI